MHANKRERAQAIVLIALAIVSIVSFTGLAIDGGTAFAANRKAQNAADAAAFSVALAKIRGEFGSDLTDVATNIATLNGFDLNNPKTSVAIHNPPINGYYSNCSSTEFDCEEYIQVILSTETPTFFAPVIGVESTLSTGNAVVRAKPQISEEMYNGNAMVSLAPTECQAYYAHGTADTYITGGGVFVNSDGSECTNANNGAFEQQGDAGLVVPDGGITVVGSAVVQTPSYLDPYPPTTGATAEAYPPDFMLPEPSCDTNATRDDDTLNPGTVDASWLRDDVFLNPGLYCIEGDLVLNASNRLEGQGVTLYFMDGGLHINGAGNFLLEAPDSGEFAGLLIYLPMENDSIVILNGNATSRFSGSILAPASEIQINGTGSTNGYSSQVIGYIVDLIGTADAYINYDDASNYDAVYPPQIELAQ
jgi:Flp pilus assembly protein TadG